MDAGYALKFVIGIVVSRAFCAVENTTRNQWFVGSNPCILVCQYRAFLKHVPSLGATKLIFLKNMIFSWIAQGLTGLVGTGLAFELNNTWLCTVLDALHWTKKEDPQ